jgi:hypothetical protein
MAGAISGHLNRHQRIIHHSGSITERLAQGESPVRAAHFQFRFQFLTALLLASVTIVLADKAFAAFYVDDFEVDEVGSCAIDSWMSSPATRTLWR